MPLRLLDLLLGTEAPFDVVIADDGMFRAADAKNVERQRKWMTVRDRTRHFLAPNRRAEAYAARLLRPHETARLLCLAPETRTVRTLKEPSAPRLAVVLGRSSPPELRVLRAVATMLGREAAEATLTVFGEVALDPSLMCLSNTFVKGAISANELPRLLRQYDIGYLLAGFGRPLFGDSVTERALASSRPVATIDWSGERVSLQPGDLALSPLASPQEIAAAVRDWMTGAPK
jgi:hypothetical protein